MSFIDIRGLKKCFGPTTVVHDFDLAIERGELLTLHGEAVGGDGRLQRRERHSQHHGKRRPCGCAAVGLSHRAIPR